RAVDPIEERDRVLRRAESQPEGDQLLDGVVQPVEPLLGAAAEAAVLGDLPAVVGLGRGLEAPAEVAEPPLGAVEVAGAEDQPLGLGQDLARAVGRAAPALLGDQLVLEPIPLSMQLPLPRAEAGV